MGSIIASCGHDVTDKELAPVSWMEYDTDIEEGIVRTVAYGVLCDDCLKLYMSWGIVLESEKEEQDWLNGKTQYPQTETN